MILLVAGSRSIRDYKLVENEINRILKEFPDINEIIMGCTHGVDLSALTYCMIHKMKYKEFKAKWSLHGKLAGFKRNIEMAEYADILLAIWDNKSRGTFHMINEMNRRNKKVFTIIV